MDAPSVNNMTARVLLELASSTQLNQARENRRLESSIAGHTRVGSFAGLGTNECPWKWNLDIQFGIAYSFKGRVTLGYVNPLQNTFITKLAPGLISPIS